MSQLLTPSLVFSISRPWTIKKYNEIYSFYPTNSLSREKLNYDNGIVRNIHYGDIHTKFSTVFCIENEDVPFINSDVDLSKIKIENYCQEGDLVVADASENYDDIGKTIEIKKLNGNKVLAGLHTFLARPNKFVMANGFVGYLMQSWFVRKQIMVIAQGTKVLGISTGRLGCINLPIPLIEEQQKIASFLASVDSKISQLTEKQRLLKEYKKGVMQQIFSQQLRFKNEDGKAFPEWEARLFSEFINTKSELPTKSFSGDLCSLTIKNGIEIKPSRYIREHLVKDIASAYKVAQVGDFVINPMNVRFGALGVNHHYKPVLISKYYDVFECDNTVDRMFFEIYLLSQKMLNHYNRVATGTLEEKKRVHFSEFLKFKKELPCLQEQQKIAQFLQSIDKKVDSVAQQVEQTKQFKKGLLQQMFV